MDLSGFDPELAARIEADEKAGGINSRTLKPGCRLEVHTKNSIYDLTPTDREGYFIAQGGAYLPKPEEVYFSGSTYGGSMIRIGWIGHRMHMEIYIPSLDKTIVTSGVRRAKVIGPDWEYEMDWHSD